jgi:hypothetical protein
MDRVHAYRLAYLYRSCVIQSVCENVQISANVINLLKPTGYVMHQQFKIQQLHVLPTLYLCVLYLSENKQRLVPLTA